MRQSSADRFFQLLRFSIGASDVFPFDISGGMWEDMYEIAQQQSLLGILFYGIEKHPEMRPPRELLLRWYAISEQIKLANQKTNKAVVELREFFQEQGFRSCILKGQGNALMYPNPYIRTSGDIDIWLEGGHDRIMEFVNGRWSDMLERYHHVEIPAWKGVAVEIHFTPSYMHVPWMNRRMQHWFAEQAEKQFSNRTELPDGAGSICIPTEEFNLIYQLSHIYRHLFSEGIGLRQMMDYYFIIRNEELGMRNYENELMNLGLRKFAGAVMWVLHEVFGLEEKFYIVPADERRGKLLLEEILIGGNFGQYDTRLGNKDGEGKLHRYFRMSLRNMRFIKHYPSEALCEPVFRTWHFFWRLLNG